MFKAISVTRISALHKPMKGLPRYFSENAAQDSAIRDIIQSEAYLGAMFECSRQGFIITDTDLTVVRYNLVAEVYFEKYAGLHLSSVPSLQVAGKKITSENLYKALLTASKGSLISYVEEHSTEEGTCWWDIHILPIYNQQGDQLGISITLQDITHVKSAGSLIKAQENEKTRMELDRLVYGLSQDLRTPVTNMLELLSNVKATGINKPDDQNFLLMEKKMGQLDNYLRNILDYTRNNRLAVQKEPVSFQEILLLVRENIRGGSKKAPVKFIERITEHCNYYGDPVRIRIILENLISNAMLYRDKKKPESIITVNIEVTTLKVKIIVADNGVGIASRHLPRIYDMFYHAGEEQQGAGLGLFVTRESIQKLNGSIRVDSTPGTGTAFEIILPNLFENTNACLQ